ncbi:acetolactate synthase 2 small subunit [Gilliamella sp. wkB112]|uniref:acetolactate synthase 2 small subunit n=1 Tax=Gilliamella sp. wkB112 TaxID=3120257 RepID=UPI00080DB68D|nr:acetolactate synthase 2 small subunit [Gilliamella apicola]OCG01228.1 hypothetical protein A9G12_01340 [Gilliamella apicola]
MSELTNYQFTIKAYDQLGAIERILRVVRHRGGHIEKLQMQTAEHNTLVLNLVLTTKRSITALQNQLTKLVDVITID